MKLRLTKRSVESLSAPSRGEIVVWDSDLKGFGLRVSVRSRLTYFVQARAIDGRQIKLKIGVHGAITADQARAVASRELGKIAAGENPAVQRKLARRAERSRLAAPTLRELAAEYIRSHAELFKRPSSIADDRSMLGLPDPARKARRRAGPKRKAATILAELGSRKVADITRRELAELHRKMIETPAQANRALALLSKMFNLAIQWELRKDNPVTGLQRYAEQPRERYLNSAELVRLSEALGRHPNTTIANAVRLLLLTGARRSEVLNATWDQFDLDGRHLGQAQRPYQAEADPSCAAVAGGGRVAAVGADSNDKGRGRPRSGRLPRENSTASVSRAPVRRTSHRHQEVLGPDLQSCGPAGCPPARPAAYLCFAARQRRPVAADYWPAARAHPGRHDGPVFSPV